MFSSRDAFENDFCPVRDELLGEMYRANANGLPLLVESVSSEVRSMLALFCYRRSHLHSLALILMVAPRFWFVAFVDFAIHITVDRIKGIIASRFGVTLENEHPWFWTLIGVDQALHHLTGFGLSIYMAGN